MSSHDWKIVDRDIKHRLIIQLLPNKHTYSYKHMGECFQEYFWIQDFEADFP